MPNLPEFEPSDPPDRVAAARYLATLSADLAVMARRHGLATLGFLLDMARLEAENESKHAEGRNG